MLENKNLNDGRKMEYSLTAQEQIVIAYIKKYNFIRRSTVEDILDVKKTRAIDIIKSLIDKDLIKQEGIGSASKYLLK